MYLIYSLIIDLIQPIYKFLKFYFFESVIIITNIFKNNNLKFFNLLNFIFSFKENKILNLIAISLYFIFLSFNFLIFIFLITIWLSLPFFITFILIK
ncbi:MAG: hypothetical protein KatS3mg095_0030 [Candidatus Parcubacteria bacterium]|nr:MAG: hypothetical protein KatS3mg095_0030 [Candidatus Parcubacteria bacterium]